MKNGESIYEVNSWVNRHYRLFLLPDSKKLDWNWLAGEELPIPNLKYDS